MNKENKELLKKIEKLLDTIPEAQATNILKLNYNAILTCSASNNLYPEDREIYPLTIVSDRYGGVYSGGNYLAFNLNADEVPEDIFASDIPCSKYWEENNLSVGRGKTIMEAYIDLQHILEAKQHEKK